MKKTKWMKYSIGILSAMGIFMSMPEDVFAHGYIQGSRVHLGTLGINQNVGIAQYEPQSIEAIGGFPMTGPADGQIASGGKYFELDEQTADRWVKQPMKGGANTFTWTLTAPHKTDEWKYYITKDGWDPNSPITRDDLELITLIDDGGRMPLETVTHTINVPTDREGYHVILGVWEIEDTVNAFYQVMDVELTQGEAPELDEEAPTVPMAVTSPVQTTNTIGLTWEAATDNVGVHHYNVYRDGQKVQVASGTAITDTGLEAETAYTYTVTAVDAAGNESTASASITVSTQARPEIDEEAPTAPINLHSMGETATTVDLHWKAATDNVGVVTYEIYCNGEKVTTTTDTRYMDKGLMPETTYSYYVKAVDAAGNVSEASNVLEITTEQETEVAPGNEWQADAIYLEGDKVTFEGVTYTARWWTKGDKPSESEVWLAERGTVLEWSETRAYNGGDCVSYEGKEYTAKWWTQGDIPGQSSVWE